MGESDAGHRRQGRRGAGRQTRVAVAGSAGTFGRLVVAALAQELGPGRVVALVHQSPETAPPPHPAGVQSHHVDLTEPTADARLADVLRREHVDTLVQAAFLSRPASDHEQAHELEVIGTLHVLSAVAAANVRRMVMLSNTMVYGAHPQNPAHLSEEAPLRGLPHFPFIRDKVEAEVELQRFVATRKRTSCTVLRLCPVVGNGLNNLWSHYYRAPVAPTVLGFDPLVQVQHPADALRAIKLAVREDIPGVFNIVGRGVVPLSTALKITGTLPFPVMRPGAPAWLGMLGATGAASFPPAMADYLTYSFVADGHKAAQELGYLPQYGAREALMHLMGVGPGLNLGAATAGEAHG